MNNSKIVIRQSRARKYLGFLLLVFVGVAILIIQGIVPDVRGVRVEWFLLVLIYIGIFKSPGTGVLITVVLGVVLDLYSGAVFGEGVFCSFFVMGCSRLISRMAYVDRPAMLFLTTLTTTLSLYAMLAIITLLWGEQIGAFGRFTVTTLLSACVTAFMGLIIFPLFKVIDPERGGYYLTQFMREEWGEPLV